MKGGGGALRERSAPAVAEGPSTANKAVAEVASTADEAVAKAASTAEEIVSEGASKTPRARDVRNTSASDLPWV